MPAEEVPQRRCRRGADPVFYHSGANLLAAAFPCRRARACAADPAVSLQADGNLSLRIDYRFHLLCVSRSSIVNRCLCCLLFHECGGGVPAPSVSAGRRLFVLFSSLSADGSRKTREYRVARPSLRKRLMWRSAAASAGKHGSIHLI